MWGCGFADFGNNRVITSVSTDWFCGSGSRPRKRHCRLKKNWFKAALQGARDYPSLARREKLLLI
jgi:hypothetical protein